MKLIVTIIITLLPSLALAQPLPPSPGGSCPHGYRGLGFKKRENSNENKA